MDRPEFKATAESVPAFTCLVYVWRDAGNFVGRVVNLEGIEAIGNSEREVLGKLVPAFKQRVAGFVISGAPIPWIESPAPPASHQQKRLVPVHL
jgi:hypothetical protein